MSMDLNVMYYYFTMDQYQVVTSVNYCYDDPQGAYLNHVGDFSSFKSMNPGYLYIPVPSSALK
jgi:hypothetical protein